ncbi:MAG TPA: alpha-ketoacid dehydrogenase subunit beta [Chloroflexota bacterium]|nr:alpha-ketoacid dehydrogenase subunit beta [Chloroflexota bacterium]
MTLAAEPTTAVRELTISQALNEALREEMRRDPTVFLLGEEIGIWGAGGGIFGVTLNLIKEFGPERVRDTPISEEAIAGLSCGAAVTGLRPVAEIMYVDFTALAMDPIVNQAAKLCYMFGGKAKVPMVIRAQEGAGRGNAAQHSQSLEAWFMHVPGLKVAVPSTPHDAKGLLKSAVRDDNPVIFLEHKALYATRGPVPEEEYLVPFGAADVKREGTDVTVVGIHTMMHRALAAAEKLAAEGISLEVIDPRTLVPLDVDAIVASVRKTKHLVIAHEAVERCGAAGEIAMQVMDRAFDYLDAPIKRVCGRNVPIPYNLALERLAIPQEEDLIAGVREVLDGAR